MAGPNRNLVVVDLDDVLVEFTARFFRWHNRWYGTNLTVEDLAESKYLFEAWNGTVGEATERVRLFFQEEDILGMDPITGADACLHSLQANHRLAVVSARSPRFAAVTESWIQRHFDGVFDQVILGIGHSERGEGTTTKGQVCQQIGASVLIDDQVAHLAGAADAGLRTLLFGRYPWNRTQPLPTGTERVADWAEVCTALI